MQQRSEEWFEARLGRVTASKIDAVMSKTKTGYTAKRGDYLWELCLERLTGEPTESFTSKPMQWGIDHEDQARGSYEYLTGFSVQEVGFVNHPELMAGASPDGLVGADGLVEIKCPNPKQHGAFLDSEAIDLKYILQMHWQMICTGRVWCDFVSFDPRFPVEMQTKIKRVEMDKSLAKDITNEVKAFLIDLDETEAKLREKYKEAS